MSDTTKTPTPVVNTEDQHDQRSTIGWESRFLLLVLALVLIGLAWLALPGLFVRLRWYLDSSYLGLVLVMLPVIACSIVALLGVNRDKSLGKRSRYKAQVTILVCALVATGVVLICSVFSVDRHLQISEIHRLGMRGESSTQMLVRALRESGKTYDDHNAISDAALENLNNISRREAALPVVMEWLDQERTELMGLNYLEQLGEDAVPALPKVISKIEKLGQRKKPIDDLNYEDSQWFNCLQAMGRNASDSVPVLTQLLESRLEMLKEHYGEFRKEPTQGEKELFKYAMINLTILDRPKADQVRDKYQKARIFRSIVYGAIDKEVDR